MTNTWTQSGISQWAEKTFGTPDNPFSLVDRANREFTELWELTHYTNHYDNETYNSLRDPEAVSKADVLEEIADVVVILSQVAHLLGGDLQDEIAKKMIKNVNRKWVITANGQGQHV